MILDDTSRQVDALFIPVEIQHLAEVREAWQPLGGGSGGLASHSKCTESLDDEIKPLWEK